MAIHDRLDQAEAPALERSVTKKVALLRGVNNIGSSNRVAMADLRVLVESLGCGDPQTLRNSGNVVFSAPGALRRDLAVRIEQALASNLGVHCQVTVLSRNEVASVVRNNPAANVADSLSHMLVMVPRESADLVRLKPLLKRRWGKEALTIGRRVAYIWCARGVAESALWPAVDRVLERSGTVRNVGTMMKILAALERSSK